MDNSSLIYMDRPVSHHASMQRAHRAKQFAPFAALKGYEEAVAAKRTRSDTFHEPGPDASEELDRTLRTFRPGDSVCITWFDAFPGAGSAGQIRTVTGPFLRADPCTGCLLVAAVRIPIRWITAAERLSDAC